MKKVLIVANFARFPWEEGNGRFDYIINSLDLEKVEIEFITSSFFHGEKKQRDINDKILENLNYKATIIKEPGYNKNVCLKRFYSHRVFSKNVEKYLNTIEKPDLIYVATPSLDVAEVAAKYAQKNNIKLVILILKHLLKDKTEIIKKFEKINNFNDLLILIKDIDNDSYILESIIKEVDNIE